MSWTIQQAVKKVFFKKHFSKLLAAYPKQKERFALNENEETSPFYDKSPLRIIIYNKPSCGPNWV